MINPQNIFENVPSQMKTIYRYKVMLGNGVFLKPMWFDRKELTLLEDKK